MHIVLINHNLQFRNFQFVLTRKISVPCQKYGKRYSIEVEDAIDK